ncbi:MAG TPA: NAD(P)H-hydrate dehydratase [Ktedonobacteraceae bacterium]|nr:NAD(P)H-hydrate dehydratase [Ktedonobacteraceae bacterium]
MHIVTVEEMRELETRAEREYGLTSAILMENAGKSAAELLAREITQQKQSVSGQKFLLLIGPGNNGGDGLVVARYLEQWGGQVSLYRWKEQRLSIRGEDAPGDQTEAMLEQAICSADYILDALLGTGRSRPLPDDMRALLRRVREERKRRETLRIVAIDLPTGLNSDTGEVDPGAIPADLTITLACPKQGFFFFPGRSYIGQLLIGNIGLPAALERNLRTEMLTDALVKQLVPGRPLESNKGTFGKVMLLCGSPPYPGSAFMAGQAAARIGAGLITLAVTEQMLPIYAGAFHEATFLLLPSSEEKSLERVDLLMESLHGYRSLLIGPGLGQSPATRETILHVLERLRALPQEQRPHLVIDADGLNNLSALEHWWMLLPRGTVITPHPGEMGRLCNGLKVSGGSIDRLDLARQKAQEWKVTLVLKGACTIIAQGQSTESMRTRINWKANAAMATAGTGDVLAGMIVGLLAQNLSPFDAASAAVYLHATAGERVSREIGQAGLLATDLLPEIPRALANLSSAYPGL